MTTALAFQSTQFDVVDQSGQPWLRGYQIGSALKYTRPDVQIAKLYRAHADEFTDSMTTVVTLPTPGGPQETRIFSLRGCHLLAMFARTAIAKEFRRWVLDVLETLGKVEAIPQALTPSTTTDRKPLNDLVQIWVDGAPITKRQAWEMIHAHFQVASIKDLAV